MNVTTKVIGKKPTGAENGYVSTASLHQYQPRRSCPSTTINCNNEMLKSVTVNFYIQNQHVINTCEENLNHKGAPLTSDLQRNGNCNRGLF